MLSVISLELRVFPHTFVAVVNKMRSHTKIYLEHFDYSTEQPEYMPCEICSNQVVDVHHIDPRRMGGSKTKDYIENLMGLCRECHNDCEDGVFSREWQIETHLDFLTYFKENGRCKLQNLRARH